VTELWRCSTTDAGVKKYADAHMTPRFAHRPERIADFTQYLSEPIRTTTSMESFPHMHSENRTPDRDQPLSRISEGWLRQGVALIQVAGALDAPSGARLIRVRHRSDR
jgi:ubiquinone/menaquinone biosynthesis C-methylase UbiE